MSSKLLAVQTEVTAITKNAENSHFKYKYFDINTLLDQLKPILTKHGLIILQPLTHIDGAAAIATTVVDAESEEVLSTSVVPLPPYRDAQAMGSAITYLRRYSLQSLFALQAEDDDGNAATRPAAAATTAKESDALILQFDNLCKEIWPSEAGAKATETCEWISKGEQSTPEKLTLAELKLAIKALVTKKAEAS